MSGLIGAPANGFAALLQQAYWRGVPFSVVAAAVKKGRKQAVHDYPFRDGGWVEDMGRALRVYRFTGYLLGDLAPAMQLALDVACEATGPGLLIHPSLGAVQVALLSASTAIRKDRMRVIEIEFEFIEAGDSLIPSIITDTIGRVLGAVQDALAALPQDLLVVAVLAAGIGAAAFAESGSVTGGYAGACQTAAADPAALVAMAAGLPVPNGETEFGRYAAGSAVAALPASATVASLQGQLATQRDVVATASAAAVTAAQAIAPASAAVLVGSLATLTEAARAAMTSPADQVRTMLGLAVYRFAGGLGGDGLQAEIAAVRDAVSALCRRCAVLSLARAASAYQPDSYDDAAALRAIVAAALDVEITAAGDAGEDATYLALSALRAAVVQDLTARGAALPLVESVILPAPLPALVVAFRLYRDAGRADDIAARAQAIHPAFSPTAMRVLAA
jgi:prophage DNA circulation protein